MGIQIVVNIKRNDKRKILEVPIDEYRLNS